jgi:hypothetical protein
MITLRISSAPPPEDDRRRRVWPAVECGLPFATFALSVPIFLACMPPPLADVDYVIVGCSSSFVAMMVALFLVTRRQMKAFNTQRSDHPGRPTSTSRRGAGSS